jgi:hypothetical protein
MNLKQMVKKEKEQRVVLNCECCSKKKAEIFQVTGHYYCLGCWQEETQIQMSENKICSIFFLLLRLLPPPNLYYTITPPLQLPTTKHVVNDTFSAIGYPALSMRCHDQ